MTNRLGSEFMSDNKYTDSTNRRAGAPPKKDRSKRRKVLIVTAILVSITLVQTIGL